MSCLVWTSQAHFCGAPSALLAFCSFQDKLDGGNFDLSTPPPPQLLGSYRKMLSLCPLRALKSTENIHPMLTMGLRKMVATLITGFVEKGACIIIFHTCFSHWKFSERWNINEYMTRANNLTQKNPWSMNLTAMLESHTSLWLTL